MERDFETNEWNLRINIDATVNKMLLMFMYYITDSAPIYIVDAATVCVFSLSMTYGSSPRQHNESFKRLFQSGSTLH